MTKGTWHVMTGLLLFWLLILVYMSTSLFQSGESPEHMEQQLLKALHELEKLRRQNAELQGLSRELKELRESIEKDNPAVDALKQKLDVANRKLKRMALLKATADKAESERAANIPILHTKDNPQGDTVANLPSLAFEQLRRQVENGVVEFWFYLRSQLNILQKNNPKVVTDTKKILQNGDDHQWTILKDLVNLTSLSGPAGWQEREAAELSQIVQKRLRYLQNPADCGRAKKLVCNINKGCGYGCQLHHVIYCFIVAYGSGRTMVLESKGWTYQRSGWEAVFQPVSDTCTDPSGSSRRAWGSPQVIENVQVVELPIVDGMHPRPDYMPQAIPADLAPRLVRLHGHPFVWWVGQFLKYLLRPQPHLKKDLVTTEKRLGFKGPIVGVHVRRTDKVGTEAAFHGIEEYMVHVENYYQLQQKIRPVDKKRVYLATDDQNLLEEARQKYADYEFIGDSEFSRTAELSSRYTDSSLIGIIMDIHFLSKSNYLVCTFSSQVCRVAYEIMQSLHPDASSWYHSLDDIYYYGGQNAHDQIAMYAHKPQGANEIALEPGNRIGIAGNHWDGYSKGTNRRTGNMGLYPSYKVRDDISIVEFPSYPEADKMKRR